MDEKFQVRPRESERGATRARSSSAADLSALPHSRGLRHRTLISHWPVCCDMSGLSEESAMNVFGCGGAFFVFGPEETAHMGDFKEHSIVATGGHPEEAVSETNMTTFLLHLKCKKIFDLRGGST